MSLISALGRSGLFVALGIACSGTAPAPPPAPIAVAPATVVATRPFTPDERAVALAVLSAAPQHGLPVISSPAALSDAALLRQVETYARWQRGGRLAATARDRRWGLRPDPFDAHAALEAALREGRFERWLIGLAPAHDAYRGLVAERRRYAAIVDAGDWPILVSGGELAPGARGPRVAALRTRLAAEGYDAVSRTPDRFDDGLATAVAAFQAHHDLPADGRVGGATLAALNVPAAARLTQIDLNLEREHWMPRLVEPDRIEVNIPDQTLVLYRAGTPILRMRTVVGRPRSGTPMFASRVERIVFNPPWLVPASIASNELLPRERARPGYLARQGIRNLGGRLVQAPGPRSALGVLKFDFSNPYSVYLHDTPSRAAFATDQRLLSHGCVRLQHPRDLAAALLAEQGWSRPQIEARLGHGPTQAVALQRRIQLFVLYRTAAVEADGRARFSRDVYGWDTQLARGLTRP